MSDKRARLLTDLIAEHGSSLERFLARKLNNIQDATEIAQETFLRLYRLEELDTVDDTRAFMFRVASNMAIDQLRRKVLHNKFVVNEQHEKYDQKGVSPEQIVAAEQELQRVYQAVDSLPIKCKQAFLLHRKSGLSYSEIAQEMNISVSSVEKHILQALKHCRNSVVSDNSK